MMWACHSSYKEVIGKIRMQAEENRRTQQSQSSKSI